MMRTLLWILLGVLCLSIGAYPLIYLLLDGKVGLLQTKSDDLLSNGWWRLGFYVHIVSGGTALMIGWLQFIKSWRLRYMSLHRAVGKLYVFMVSVSGVTAVGIASYSSTGLIASLGFGCLGIAWLYFTFMAYQSIRRGDVPKHERFMIYSYSACFAAVMLRLWLLLLTGVVRLDFSVAYPIVAWLSWVPNLVVARVVTSRTFSAERREPSGTLADGR